VSESETETTDVQLINHALGPMLNEHGAQGWRLVDITDEWVATLERPAGGDAPALQYATAPLVPAARDVIIEQWTDQGYEFLLESQRVGYFVKPREA